MSPAEPSSAWIASSALFTVGIEVVTVERLEQPVPECEVLQSVAHLYERNVDALVVELVVELLEHLGACDVDVGDRLALEHDPPRSALSHEVADLPAERSGVREEERRLPPVDHDALELLGLGVLLDAVPSGEVRNSPEHRAVRPPAVVEHEQHRQDDRDHDAGEHAEHDHPGAGRQREHDGARTHPRVLPEKRRRPSARAPPR